MVSFRFSSISCIQGSGYLLLALAFVTVLKMMMMRMKDDVEYRDVDNASRTSEFSALAPLCTTGIFDSIIESCFQMTEHFNQNDWLQNYINK